MAATVICQAIVFLIALSCAGVALWIIISSSAERFGEKDDIRGGCTCVIRFFLWLIFSAHCEGFFDEGVVFVAELRN